MSCCCCGCLRLLQQIGENYAHATRTAGLADRKAFAAFLRPWATADWVVYAKEPFAGPEHVLRYLSRYTLAQMLEISTDHSCDAVGQHTPIGLPSSNRFCCHRPSMVLAAARTICRAGTRHQIAIEPAVAAYSPFRDFVHRRFADAGRRWVWLRHPRPASANLHRRGRYDATLPHS